MVRSHAHSSLDLVACMEAVSFNYMNARMGQGCDRGGIPIFATLIEPLSRATLNLTETSRTEKYFTDLFWCSVYYRSIKDSSRELPPHARLKRESLARVTLRAIENKISKRDPPTVAFVEAATKCIGAPG